mgnify:FL=1
MHLSTAPARGVQVGPIDPVSQSVWQWLLSNDPFTRDCMSQVGWADTPVSLVCSRDTQPLVEVVTSRDSVTATPVRRWLRFHLKCCTGATNIFGTMHGGVLLTLTDILTSMHMMHDSVQPESVSVGDGCRASRHPATLTSLPLHVSVSLSTKFVAAVPEASSVIAVTELSKVGKRLIYSNVEFASSDGVVFAVGNHVKSLMARPFDVTQPLPVRTTTSTA